MRFRSQEAYFLAQKPENAFSSTESAFPPNPAPSAPFRPYFRDRNSDRGDSSCVGFVSSSSSRWHGSHALVLCFYLLVKSKELTPPSRRVALSGFAGISSVSKTEGVFHTP